MTPLAVLGVASTLALLVSCDARSAPTRSTAAPAVVVDTRHAEVGAKAPEFALHDLEGKEVHLADFQGKIVVLEWFNPECPFVRAAHTKGSLKGLAKRHTTDGVVWLAINSSAPGKQGASLDRNVQAKQLYGMDHPILLDPGGDVGQSYGATNTPHMFVIDASGKLVYRGAIDNSPDGEAESPTNGKLVNYVDAAVADVAAGRPVATKETAAYGCSVKYAH